MVAPMTPTTFTPLAALAGGALIGLSAVLMMALSGRIVGIAGIAARLLPPYEDGALAFRLAFVLGLVAAPFAVALATGAVPPQTLSENLAMMAGAGLLVGFGSVLGGGCTSGHGVCGLARFSPRSLVATSVFMATAAATVFVTSHLLGA